METATTLFGWSPQPQPWRDLSGALTRLGAWHRSLLVTRTYSLTSLEQLVQTRYCTHIFARNGLYDLRELLPQFLCVCWLRFRRVDSYSRAVCRHRQPSAYGVVEPCRSFLDVPWLQITLRIVLRWVQRAIQSIHKNDGELDVAHYVRPLTGALPGNSTAVKAEAWVLVASEVAPHLRSPTGVQTHIQDSPRRADGSRVRRSLRPPRSIRRSDADGAITGVCLGRCRTRSGKDRQGTGNQVRQPRKRGRRCLVLAEGPSATRPYRALH